METVGTKLNLETFGYIAGLQTAKIALILTEMSKSTYAALQHSSIFTFGVAGVAYSERKAEIGFGT